MLGPYLQAQRQRLLDELFAFLRIPSISTLPDHQADMARAAAFVAESLRRAGLEHVAIISTSGHPLVYGDWLHAPGKPTVLCYGHYDVQPPDPLELWQSPPFEPTVRNGEIYARGAADDKGQMYMHIKAVEALMRLREGQLPLNVKFLIEGEEEIGGQSISQYVLAHQQQLKADVALISDTALWAPGVPTLCIGLRGLIYAEIHAQGPARDLHSGIYGGVAPNPIFGLIEVLARMKDVDGRIRIPGVYEDVLEPAPEERSSWAQLGFDEAAFLANEVGSTRLVGESDRHVLERCWTRPTLEVHGIAGGFTGIGAKTVIPATATAKVSLRLVPNQDPAKIIGALKQFLADHTPAGIRLSLRVLSQSPGLVVNPSHPAIQTAAAALAHTLGRPTVFIRGGGSIPIVGDFHRYLGIPTVLMGFGLPDDGLHSPNEKYRISNYFDGILTIARFFELYGQ